MSFNNPTFKTKISKKINALSKQKAFLFSLAFLIVFSFSLTIFAAPFAPGATLDPGCTPGSGADCTVAPVSMGSSITSATAGSILFAGTAGIMAQDNANLFWDDTNNRLGIGTATPTYILSLGGTSARTIWMERNTTAATAGQGLTLASGGAIAGTADLAGGDLNIKSGISTGTGTSALRFFTATASGTGTSDNTPTEKMTILGSGNVGIGTATPTTTMEIVKLDTGANTNTLTIRNDGLRHALVDAIASTDSAGFRGIFNGSRSRGTQVSPTDVITDDQIASFSGKLYIDGSYRSNVAINMFTGATPGVGSHPTYITFDTTGNNEIVRSERMRISGLGNVGIGSTTKLSRLTVTAPADRVLSGTTTANATTTITGVGTIFQSVVGVGDRISLSSASSTYATVTAITDNTSLTVDSNLGDGSSQTINVKKSIFRLDDSSNVTKFIVNDLGSVGIGTTAPLKSLQVIGDVRIGTSGSNGCLEGYDGTLITGTCASDKRLKKDIVPLSGVLDRITQLSPSSYYYRSDEFPSMQLATSRQYGLVAQDAEKVFPELLAENVRGEYKGIKYQLLPIYLLEAIKELNLKVNNISGLTSNGGGISVMDQLANTAEKFINGIVRIARLVVGSPTARTGITLYDEVTGDPYCLSIANGATKTVSGECLVITPAPAPTPTVEPEPVPEPEITDTEIDTPIELPVEEILDTEVAPDPEEVIVVEESTPELEPVTPPTPASEPVADLVPLDTVPIP